MTCICALPPCTVSRSWTLLGCLSKFACSTCKYYVVLLPSVLHSLLGETQWGVSWPNQTQSQSAEERLIHQFTSAVQLSPHTDARMLLVVINNQ